jgi:hypothetical protein
MLCLGLRYSVFSFSLSLCLVVVLFPFSEMYNFLESALSNVDLHHFLLRFEITRKY